MPNSKTVRTSPEVEETLLNDFKTAIRVFNEGKLKGRLGPSIEEAMQLYVVAMYAREPGRLKNIEQYVNPEEVSEIDSVEEHQERIINSQDRLSATMQEVAHQLQRESPGGETRFEQYLRVDDADGAPDEKDQVLENSLLG